jgi:hypothetical protein
MAPPGPARPVDVLVEVLEVVPLAADRDAEQDEVALRGEDDRLHADLRGVRAVDAHVGDARRAANEECGLDPFPVAGYPRGRWWRCGARRRGLPLEELPREGASRAPRRRRRRGERAGGARGGGLGLYM